MKCEDCVALLEEYGEDELGESLSDDVRAHVAACVACASAFEEMRRAEEAYTSYFLAAEPTSALWTNFQQGIEREKAARSISTRFRQLLANVFGVLSDRPAYAATLALIAVGITFGVMKYRDSREGSHLEAVSVPTSEGTDLRSPSSSTDADKALAMELKRKMEDQRETIGSDGAVLEGNKGNKRPRETLLAVKRGYAKRTKPGATTPDAKSLSNDSVRRAEQRYLAAIAALSPNVNRRRRQLDGGAIAQLNQAIADLDRMIADTRKAVREHPNDPLAVMYMTLAYEKKVEVFRQLARS